MICHCNLLEGYSADEIRIAVNKLRVEDDDARELRRRREEGEFALDYTKGKSTPCKRLSKQNINKRV